jgi:putative hydrolase of the HAD superfamily
MGQERKVILWDFDGTLVKFTSWRLALMDVLDEYEPGHGIDPEKLRPFLRDGFPWHRPDEPHLHLYEPDKWWRALEPLFIRAYQGVGFNYQRSLKMAGQVRRKMKDPGRYILYDDAIQALHDLKQRGWKHVILSNHMPELPQIVDSLGLSAYIDFCITSGVTGYEKPNPKAFSIVLDADGYPDRVWMVGDNLNSDIKGAESSGIPAILVHSPRIEDVTYYAPSLTDVVNIIENSDSSR